MPKEKDLIIQGQREENTCLDKADTVEFKAPIDQVKAK